MGKNGTGTLKSLVNMTPHFLKRCRPSERWPDDTIGSGERQD
jgi:hypothetical protein